jgi:hypothetical protein
LVLTKETKKIGENENESCHEQCKKKTQLKVSASNHILLFISRRHIAYIKNKQNPILYLHAEHSEAQYGILHYEIQLDCLCEKRTWPIESLVACTCLCVCVVASSNTRIVPCEFISLLAGCNFNWRSEAYQCVHNINAQAEMQNPQNQQRMGVGWMFGSNANTRGCSLA